MKWITIRIRVDVETGEILNKDFHKHGYYTIRLANKTVKINEKQSIGNIYYTYECRRATYTQREIFEDSI